MIQIYLIKLEGGTEGKIEEWNGSCHLQRATGWNWQKKDLKLMSFLTKYSGEEDKARRKSAKQSSDQTSSIDSESNIYNI